MGLSETILAAIIGALATMATAIVQLLAQPRARGIAPEEEPRALDVRDHRAGARLHGRRLLLVRAARRERPRGDRRVACRSANWPRGRRLTRKLPRHAQARMRRRRLAGHPDGGQPWRGRRAESLAHLPPCRVTQQAEDAGPTACSESLAPTDRAVRAGARRRSQTTDGTRRGARAEERLALGRTADAGATHARQPASRPRSTREYPVSPEKRSVCLDVSNWSVEDTLAVRVIVDYAFGRGVRRASSRRRAPSAQTLLAVR